MPSYFLSSVVARLLTSAIIIVALLDGSLAKEEAANSNKEEQRSFRPGQGDFSNAKRVAASRAVVSASPNNGFYDPMAQLFAGPEVIDQIGAIEKNITDKRNQVSTVVSRTMLIDHYLHKAVASDPHGPKQVVILGAGFDTRAYRFAHLPVQWFELDLPEPQEFKREVLKNEGIMDENNHEQNKNIVRVPCNLLTEDWKKALEEAGWDPAAPTIYILEGLIYYFDTDDAKKLLHSIPAAPFSRIIVSVIEQSLEVVFLTYGMPANIWKTNFRKLKRSGALKIPFYEQKRNVPNVFPHKHGLNVRVKKYPTRSLWERIQRFFHTPCERVLEFVAI